jgi:hypothetical protein
MVGHKFNTTIATYNKGFMQGVTQLLTEYIIKELDVLVARPKSRFNMKRFTPEHIESFNPTTNQAGECPQAICTDVARDTS